MKKYSIKAGDVELTPIKEENAPDTVWGLKWRITERKGDKRAVGEISFAGEPERGTVEILFNIDDRFKETSYGIDAVREMVEWTFAGKGIYEITATALKEDDFSVDVLERSGFVYRLGNRTEEHYSIVKPKTVWLGLYIALGICAGLLLGVVLGVLWVGMVIGVFAGAIIGSLLDSRENKARADITGVRRSEHRRPVTEIEDSGSIMSEDKEAENGESSEKGLD